MPNAAAYNHVIKFGGRGVIGVIKWFAVKNNSDAARLGTAVPKRLIRSAVRRNRIKRIIKESFRYNKNALNGLDVVVIVHKPVTNDAVIQDKIEQVWSRVAEQNKTRVMKRVR